MVQGWRYAPFPADETRTGRRRAPPPPPDATSPAELSPGLVFVLIVGGLCAFLGAVLLVSAGWGVVGELGRVAMLAALTVVSLGAGQLASSRGLATGAAVAHISGDQHGHRPNPRDKRQAKSDDRRQAAQQGADA
jgi:hypothetical protein